LPIGRARTTPPSSSGPFSPPPDPFDSRDLEIIGGYEFSQNTVNGFGVQTRNYVTDAFTFNSLGSGNTVEPPYAFKTDSRIVSFFSRANLGLAEKYFLTYVIRKDGASEFGANHKWAVFPAISGSWRLKPGMWMRTGPLSELRLRAGWEDREIRPYRRIRP